VACTEAIAGGAFSIIGKFNCSQRRSADLEYGPHRSPCQCSDRKKLGVDTIDMNIFPKRTAFWWQWAIALSAMFLLFMAGLADPLGAQTADQRWITKGFEAGNTESPCMTDVPVDRTSNAWRYCFIRNNSTTQEEQSNA